MDISKKNKNIYDIIKYKNESSKKKEIEKIIEDIYNSSSIVFEALGAKDEIGNLLRKFVNFEEKKANMEENFEIQETSEDVKEDYIDTLKSANELKTIIDKLSELEIKRPKRLYGAIFYERYINNLSSREIADKLNLTAEDVNGRIFEIVRYVKNLKEHF